MPKLCSLTRTLDDDTAASTNVYDLGAAVNIAPGEPLTILCQVTTDFAGGTTVSVAVQTETTDGGTFDTTLVTTAAIATATLVAGYQFTINFMPDTAEQFIRLLYTGVGTFTAGNISAGVILDRQAGEVATA
jgi:hypothetical protein